MQLESKNLRISEPLHYELKMMSAQHGVPITSLLSVLLAHAFDGEAVKNAPSKERVEKAINELNDKFTVVDFAVRIEGRYTKNEMSMILMIKCLDGELKKEGMVYQKVKGHDPI